MDGFLGPSGALPDPGGSRCVPEPDRAGEPLWVMTHGGRAPSHQGVLVRSDSRARGPSRPAGRNPPGRRAAGGARRWGAQCVDRGCSCSTSSRWGCRPSLSTSSTAMSIQLAAEGITVVVVEISHAPRCQLPPRPWSWRTDGSSSPGRRARWNRCFTPPTWEPSDPRMPVRAHGMGRQITPMPTREAARRLWSRGSAACTALSSIRYCRRDDSLHTTARRRGPALTAGRVVRVLGQPFERLTPAPRRWGRASPPTAPT